MVRVAGYRAIRRTLIKGRGDSKSHLLCPIRIPLLTPLANRVLAHLPGLRRLDPVHYLVARAGPDPTPMRPLICTVAVPCRNEVGNIPESVARIPLMGSRTEILFGDGDSTDGTPQAIGEAIPAYRGPGAVHGPEGSGAVPVPV